jgi:hypothetical protein
LPQVFPPEFHINFSFSPIRATCFAHLILLDFITRTIFGEQYRPLSSSSCNLLKSPVISSLLGPNIFLRNYLKHSQPICLPEYEWPSFRHALFLIFVLFYILFVCICVLYYCHRVATQLQLNISYRISYHVYHIIYHIYHIKYHIIYYIIYIISYIILYHIYYIIYIISYHMSYIIYNLISYKTTGKTMRVQGKRM